MEKIQKHQYQIEKNKSKKTQKMKKKNRKALFSDKRRKSWRRQKKNTNKQLRGRYIKMHEQHKTQKVNQKNKQGIVFQGENCDFIDFGSVGSLGSGCVDGTKMVLKNK